VEAKQRLRKRNIASFVIEEENSDEKGEAGEGGVKLSVVRRA
jgi:hypothetical protein